MRSASTTISIAIILSVSLLARAQAPDGHQYFRLAAEVDRAQQFQYRFAWSQANSITKDVTARYQGAALDPADPSRRMEWVMTDRSDITLEYFRQTATVVNAMWRFEHAPHDSAFAPGSYAGYVRTYKTDPDGVVTQSLMVAMETLTIVAAPGWETVPVIGPITATNYIPIPSPWPDGYFITRSNGVEVAVPPPEGGGGPSGDGSLNPYDFVDTDSVTWVTTGGQMRAHAQAGTTLRKLGINLMGVYRLGDGFVVDGDLIDTTARPLETNGLTYTFGVPVGGLSAPVYQGAPYETAQWRLVPNFSSLPSTGAPLALWWHPTQQYWFLDQPYAFSQGPLDTNVIFIGTNVAAYSFTGVTNTFIVPPGVSNIQVKLWGGAGSQANTVGVGGQGGYVNGFLPVTAGETLGIVVAGTTNPASHFLGQWPDGGRGAQAGGGGSSSIRRGTNVLAVAGGGGGARWSSTAGFGGGLSGGNGSGTGAGTGGTQAAGGGAGGAWMSGGSSTDINTSGGGGGWYGGGYGNVSGGGGSSYIARLVAGVTFAFANTFDDDYAAGVGVPSGSTLTAGGPGRVVIRW